MIKVNRSIQSMRRKWDEAARKNVLYYIATSASQSEEEFIKSGRFDAEKILSGLPAFDSQKDEVLEIGCGIGRLLRALADRFASLHGVDISEEMISRGSTWLQGYPTITIEHNPNSDLSMFKAGTFAFVYSYITFQHIPDRRIIENYIHEAHRVLRPGGYLRFQTLRVESLYGAVKNWGRILLNRSGDYFAGYCWKPAALEKAVRASGFTWITITPRLDFQADAPHGDGQPTSHLWCTARKS